MIDKDYVAEIKAGISREAIGSRAAFRRETQKDVNAGYRAEVDYVERQLFDAEGRPAYVAHAMAHKCSNGASDTTDNGQQRPDPA